MDDHWPPAGSLHADSIWFKEYGDYEEATDEGDKGLET
jgi:hypothetical protein